MMLTEFWTKNKNRFFLGLFAIVQIADLLAVHFLLSRKILPGCPKLLAVINAGNMQYNTQGYFTGLFWVKVIISSFVGGFLVFGITKITELLVRELKLAESNLLSGFVPALFTVIYIILSIIAFFTELSLHNLGSALLAYFTGTLMWATTIKWKTEIEKGIKI